MFRIGLGFDTHRLVEGRSLILGGVRVASTRGAEGHSDADALTHAITDAILGALCEGDLGTHFSDQDPRWKDADSLQLLEQVMKLVSARNLRIVNVDANILLEQPKLRPYIQEMREKLAKTLKVEMECVSVKAKTGEGVDAVGENRAVTAQAIVLLERASS